jgi:hypothetical protein
VYEALDSGNTQGGAAAVVYGCTVNKKARGRVRGWRKQRVYVGYMRKYLVKWCYGPAVQSVAQQRMPDVRHVHAQLRDGQILPPPRH